MNLVATPLAGAFVLELRRLEDERGFFARTFDAELFEQHGLDARVAQCNLSVNRHAGTLRGMHFQTAPHAEAKLVRVVRGAVFDAIIDLRPGSDTFRRWFGVELTEDNDRSLFVPAGFAHGFQTLVDDTEMLYQMSYPFVPGAGSGVRWDDPAFDIAWPQPPAGGRVMSERDAQYPDFVA
ncbi:MAG: dTDP-4-dehydrorhamnose 3,5-epimerase [Solirubrobacterales bacterium]|nr:dTDP-4-dehydrorhamnose 3,5-epimerase [Solirubrobacterales bacterium]